MNISTKTIERRPEFADVLREDLRFATGEATGPSEAVNGWFDHLIVHSGIRTPPLVWLGLCLLSGLAVGGFLFVITEQLLLTAAGFILGVMLPLVLAMVLRSRRQKTILEQLPGVAEELARVARTGRSMEQCFLTVASDTPSPLGDELRTSARRTELGTDLATATRDLTERTGVTALTVFSSAIAVHQDTGGDLIAVLERLASAVRDRIHFVSRMRSATVAARMGTIMMVLIPILIIGFFLFRDPQYLTNLTRSFWGRLSLGAAIVLQIIGGLIVFRILRRAARF